MKKTFLHLAVIASILSPLMVFAAQGDAAAFGGLNTFFLNITAFLGSTILPFLFAIALVAFVYGIFKYFILGGANEDDRESGKSLMIWGILGLVLIVAVWGIVNLVISVLDSSTGATPFDNTVNVPAMPV